MLLAGMILFNFLWAQDSNPSKMDLHQTLRWAEEHSPDFQKLQHNLKIAELEAESARKFWLPRVDLSTTHGVLDRDPRFAYEPWNSSFDLTLSENIYDDGQAIEKKKLNQKKLELAILNKKNEKEKLTLDLAVQFLRYSLAIKNQELQEAQLTLIRRQFNTASSDYHQGVKTQRDFLRFKTQLNRGEIDLLGAKNSVLKSRQDLIRLSGGDDSKSSLAFSPLPLSEMNQTPPTGLLQLETHPRYIAYLVSQEIEDLQTQIAKKSLTPSLTLSAGSTYSSANYLGTHQRFEDNDSLSWNVLLTLKYNLFDGGERDRNYQMTLETSAVNRSDLRAQILSLKSDLEQWSLDLEQSKANQKLANELFILEKKNRELIETDYRNGKVSFLDLTTSMRDYLDAQFKYSSAIYESEVLRMTYLSHIGKLNESLLR